MSMSQFDKDNLELVMSGYGDWFGAELLRLIRKADSTNLELLRLGFPEQVSAVEEYRTKVWSE